MHSSSPSAKPSFVVAGFASLLVSAFLDNIRGPLLPVVARDLGLDHTTSGLGLSVSYLAAAGSAAALIHALNRWSERSVLLVAAVLGIGLGAVAPLVGGYGGLLAFSCLTGVVVSIFGTMSNVLVLAGTPAAWQGRALAGVHAMYGLGSLSGAVLVAAAVAASYHWSALYTSAIPCFASVLAFAGLAMRPRKEAPPRTVQDGRLTPVHLAIVGFFGLYVIGEVMTSLWLSSYLVEVERYTPEGAAKLQTVYFLVLTLVRLACVVLIRPRWERAALTLALVLPVAAFFVGRTVHPAALAGMGLTGPFFPVMLARASRFHADKWRTITIWTIVGSNVLLAGASLSLGAVAARFGIERAFHLPPLLLLLALAGLWAYFTRLERNHGAFQ